MTFKKSLSIAIIAFSFLLPFKLAFCDNQHSADEHDKKVKISILSKRLRHIKERTLDELEIIFPAAAVITDTDNHRQFSARNLKIILRNDNLCLTGEGREFSRPFNLTVNSENNDETVTVRFTDEERIYPLPLKISSDKDNLSLIITESVLRYAHDAAIAEYETDEKNQAEAIAALTMLIAARRESGQYKHRHADFEFCDLSHCQIYKGRTSPEADIERKYPWRINMDAGLTDLYFHTRCGGNTLSAKVFRASTEQAGVKDWLLQEGKSLCIQNDKWEARLTRKELLRLILNNDASFIEASLSLDYDRQNLKIILQTADTIQTFAPEDFRLQINRIYGWNFIRSNNYRITEKYIDGTNYIVFKGTGSGHGAGLCQAGALKLAELGYSRYEILEHYFPEIRFIAAEGMEKALPHDVSYVIFSLQTGKIEKSSYQAITARKIPSGSIFKLIIALYLATEKPEFLHKYSYQCRSHSDDNMPEKCWRPDGHGKIGFSDALSHSCNLYFASLYRIIDKKKFKTFFDNFCLHLNIKSKLPPIKNDREFSHLLAGLDYRLKFTVKDMINIARLFPLTAENNNEIEPLKQKMTLEARTIIYNALLGTMIKGTASYNETIPGNGHEHVKRQGKAESGAGPLTADNCKVWGKTASILHGTNKIKRYGVFMGGCGNRGILLIYRNANGRKAAKLAVDICFKRGY